MVDAMRCGGVPRGVRAEHWSGAFRFAGSRGESTEEREGTEGIGGTGRGDASCRGQKMGGRYQPESTI
eukprot:760975-Rhodomonas_salina.2